MYRYMIKYDILINIVRVNIFERSILEIETNVRIWYIKIKIYLPSDLSGR